MSLVSKFVACRQWRWWVSTAS